MKYKNAYIPIWLTVLSFATVMAYIESKAYLQWLVDGRRRDLPDQEWEVYKIIFPNLIFDSLFRVFIKEAFPSNMIKAANFLLSMGNLTQFYGRDGAVVLLCMTIISSIVFHLGRRKFTHTYVILVLIFEDRIEMFVEIKNYNHQTLFHQYIFLHSLRVISFANEYKCQSFMLDCIELLNYCLYTPTSCFGPLITYNDFNRILNEHCSFDKTQLLKCVGMYIFNEILSVCLPFRALSENVIIHPSLSPFTLVGCIFLNGLYIFSKYYVIYGIAAAFIGNSGISRPPCCTVHIYRYSLLWRDFDYGLYLFIRKYVYQVLVEKLKNFPLGLRHTSGKIFSFIFVALWHGFTMHMITWVLFNYIASILESMTNYNYSRLRIRFQFVREPWFKAAIFLPTTAVSIFTNSIICSSLETTISFLVCFTKSTYNILILFLSLYSLNLCGICLERRNESKTK